MNKKNEIRSLSSVQIFLDHNHYHYANYPDIYRLISVSSMMFATRRWQFRLRDQLDDVDEVSATWNDHLPISSHESDRKSSR